MRSACEGHELAGIQSKLDDVVQHGQNGSSGEDNHEEHDKSKLDDLQSTCEKPKGEALRHQLIVIGKSAFVLRELKLILSIGLAGNIGDSGQLRVDWACRDFRILLLGLRIFQLGGIPFRCVGIFLRRTLMNK